MLRHLTRRNFNLCSRLTLNTLRLAKIALISLPNPTSRSRIQILPSTFCWKRKWQPTPVFLPGESQGRGSLVGCCLRDRTESDTTEVTQQQQQHRNFTSLSNNGAGLGVGGRWCGEADGTFSIRKSSKSFKRNFMGRVDNSAGVSYSTRLEK